MSPVETYLPAEWEPQSAIQLTWPHTGTDWLPYLEEVTRTFIELAKVIVRHELLLVVSPEPMDVKARLLSAIEPRWHDRLRFCECPTNDTWARDHGALTLKSGNRNLILDFRFNGWGEKFPWQKDNGITRRLMQAGLLHGDYESHDDFVLEGGSIESDDKGTIFTTSQCLLAPHRNQPLTKDDIEEELKRRLHARRVIWLDHGQLIGDDTDGHIDTLVRTAPGHTLCYVMCTEDDSQYAELHALEQQLHTLEPEYRLLRLPTPRPIYYEGERLPATYANFLVLNDAVIYPTYGQPDLDREARQVIAKAFPDRELTGIDATVLIRQHGSIHCLTMQYPQGVII